MLKRLAMLAVLIPLAISAILAGQNAPKTAPKKRIAKQEDQNSSKTQPVIVQVQSPTQSREDLEIQQKLVDFTGGLVIVTGLIVVAGIVQAVILNRQARLMGKHAEHLQGLVNAATDNAKSAQDSAETALKQANHIVASERAWILPISVILSSGASDRSEGNEQVFIQCAAENHGRTAARVLGLKALAAIGPVSDPGQTWDQSLYDPDSQTAPRTVILPNKATALHCPVPGFTAKPGQEVRGDYKPGEALFIHGVIRYWDMFSETDRFTRFCLRWHNVGEPPGTKAGFHFAGGDRYNQQT